MRDNHYDFIIIGSGAGGGTLALKLAPSGKRILILERGEEVESVADLHALEPKLTGFLR